MEIVGRTCDLVFYHTWMLCKHCDLISTSDRVNHKLKDTNRNYLEPVDDFSIAESMCILQKGEGVVGKAATSSHNLVYCEDVTKITITEYPLAHFARQYDLTACFAISLQSNLTGDQVYVLEIFPSSNYVKETGWLVMFSEIIEVMRLKFQTFKFASGVELTCDFDVQQIHASSPGIFRRKRITWKILCFVLLFVIRIRHLCLTGENFIYEADDPMTGIETSFKDPLENAIEFEVWFNESMNMQFDDWSYVDEHNAAAVRRKRRTWKIVFLALVFVNSLVKKVCRRSYFSGNNLPRVENMTPNMTHIDFLGSFYPNSSVGNVQGRPNIFSQSIGESSTEETDQTSSRDSYGQATRFVSCTTVQSGCYVTVKAKYGDDFIKFQFLDSSGIEAFKEQVSKRLKLEDGAFVVKYQDDEHDWILLTCDTDLHHCISSSIKLEKYTLSVSIMPVV